MNELNDQQLFQYFKKQIQSEGEKDLANEKQKFEQLMVEKKQAIQENLKAKFDIKAEMVRSELKNQYEQAVRKIESSIQVNFGKNRIASLETLFGSVVKKIQAFTDTDAYPTTILKWIQSLPNYSDTLAFTISIRPQDNRLNNVLKQTFKQAKIVLDPTISLGGVYVKTNQQSMRYDLTLDSQWKLIKTRYFEQDVIHE